MTDAAEQRYRDDVYDEVYEASLDSFPASDAPSWAATRVGGPPRRDVRPSADAPGQSTRDTTTAGARDPLSRDQSAGERSVQDHPMR